MAATLSYYCSTLSWIMLYISLLGQYPSYSPPPACLNPCSSGAAELPQVGNLYFAESNTRQVDTLKRNDATWSGREIRAAILCPALHNTLPAAHLLSRDAGQGWVCLPAMGFTRRKPGTFFGCTFLNCNTKAIREQPEFLTSSLSAGLRAYVRRIFMN